MNSSLFTLWSDNPGVSGAIWLVILILVLYLGRYQAHNVLSATATAIRSAMRMISRSLARMARNLSERNRAIVLAAGREATEKAIEREFARVHTIVARDLSYYPALHRQISDSIEKIEKDYQNSTDSPPLPPAWLETVETIAAIPRNGDPKVSKILNNIHKTVEAAYSETKQNYQQQTLERHRLLGGMQPLWRSLVACLNKVKGTIDGLDERTKLMDKLMEKYEKIRAGDEEMVRVLTASSLTQFFIATLVLIIAMLGGLINFQLIALPMSEMVGGSGYIGDMRTSDIAALVIIMIEVAMGLFLMESLRITQLFPIISSMDDRMRKRMTVITFSILTILATIEASLAYMRDLLAMDREALQQSLAGGEVIMAQFRWIPSIGQMVMGFILPFALAFVAIPLESFIHSLRTVIGLVCVGLLRTIAVAARLVGNSTHHISKVLIGLYDLVIMLPITVERLIGLRLQESSEHRGLVTVSTSNHKEKSL